MRTTGEKVRISDEGQSRTCSIGFCVQSASQTIGRSPM